MRERRLDTAEAVALAYVESKGRKCRFCKEFRIKGKTMQCDPVGIIKKPNCWYCSWFDRKEPADLLRLPDVYARMKRRVKGFI